MLIQVKRRKRTHFGFALGDFPTFAAALLRRAFFTVLCGIT